jgi:hypothetical protein
MGIVYDRYNAVHGLMSQARREIGQEKPYRDAVQAGAQANHRTRS